MRTSGLFGARNFRFFEIYGVSARTRGKGYSQCEHLADKGGEGSIFHDFVRTSFINGPLILQYKDSWFALLIVSTSIKY